MTGEMSATNGRKFAQMKAETRPGHDATESSLDLTSGPPLLATYRWRPDPSHGFDRSSEGIFGVGDWDEHEVNHVAR